MGFAAMSSSALPHILVIDDEQTIRELVSTYLSKNDMRVTCGSSGREGAQAAADRLTERVG